jgi:prevent-host-death family protein
VPGKAIPYGVYDLANDEGWVSVGIDHDTADFAVNAIRLWWTRMGRHRFPRARRLLTTADGGGSHGPRSRLWKWALQRFAVSTIERGSDQRSRRWPHSVTCRHRCAMRERSVGIRELKSKLSECVRDVKRGAAIVVTEHGKRVARLVPEVDSLEDRRGPP